MSLLRAGLTESTITTLQVDWNPVELPPDAVGMRSGLGEDLVDDCEQRRERLQKERQLRAFGELLQQRAGGRRQRAYDGRASSRHRCR